MVRGAAGSGASGSSTTRARLRVPAGAPDQASGGERSSPSQVWRAGISSPSVNAADLISNMALPRPRHTRLASPMPAPAESPSTGAPAAPGPSLFPREHGAWGQLAFPLATGLNIGRPGPAAFLLCAAVVAAFLGHEPLLVVLGQRGHRARDAHGRRALRALAVSGAA